jgi:hypothetical protein
MGQAIAPDHVLAQVAAVLNQIAHHVLDRVARLQRAQLPQAVRLKLTRHHPGRAHAAKTWKTWSMSSCSVIGCMMEAILARAYPSSRSLISCADVIPVQFNRRLA